MRPIWAHDLDYEIWTPRVCFIGGGSSSSKQQSQSGPTTNPAFPMLQGNVQRATSIADMPFEAYTGEIAPGSNPMLDMSSGMFGNIGANNTGASTLGFGIDATRGVAGYQPGSDASLYMNPFQRNVIDTTMGDLARQRNIARVSDNQAATAAQAFGGARQGVADSLTNDAYDRNAASTLANLNFQNFGNAQNMGLAGAGLRLNAGAQLGAMSDQELNQALSRANAVNQAGTQQRTIQQQLDDAAYQEFMRRLQYPIQGQDLINRAMGLLPGGISQQSTGSGSQSGWNFAFSPPK